MTRDRGRVGAAPACDCHIHIYDDAYPLAPTATFRPPHAPVDAYRRVQRALGLERVVVVQPTGYGYDNRCLLAALAAFGPSARGVATLPRDVPDAELERLHAAGVRGVRFMMLAGGLSRWDDLDTMAARIAPLGWHIDLQLDGRTLPDVAPALAALCTPLVIDHMGKFLEPVEPDAPAFVALRRLLDGGRTWVKLSAPYETSHSGAPDYRDVARLASVLAREHGARCVWGSNWPHPNASPVPDDAALLNWLCDCAGDAARADAILAHNAAALYGF
ncbi:putative amidohydrolase [Burkholderia multivorans]|uniref:Amidohydrolase n=1 Tax=Burkholderia multivorans TaxID=87883 RepID=A0ABD7L990_9BURK|nr:amidohydrolase family protein [Burkholderia multivorans]MBU9160411.1 amidohydrolase family protein [Burkholderia multivorans]MBU9258897.1 amidohydrolase family protein [Burkholderia multivorans]MBU9487339.1 amidohydrolase family protein [Burkholderia multivorans]SAJ95394.1 putative amidohydrolase [Burkholderia multivorans]SAJ99960.1 putative amidohydrolase [Burkholderia multivorans]